MSRIGNKNTFFKKTEETSEIKFVNMKMWLNGNILIWTIKWRRATTKNPLWQGESSLQWKVYRDENIPINLIEFSFNYLILLDSTFVSLTVLCACPMLSLSALKLAYNPYYTLQSNNSLYRIVTSHLTMPPELTV